MKKLAQLAVETLLIYGVAILIVMAAIGALLATGVLNPGELLPDQCQIGDTWTCENYEITPTGVNLELRNSYGKNIERLNVTIEGQGDNQGLWNCFVGNQTTVIVNGELTSPIFIPCDIKVPAGKKIQGKLFIQFIPVGSKISRTVTGSIRASVIE